MKNRSTLTPGIPDIRDDNIKDVIAAIKKTLEVREGRSGDSLDGNVTFRHLQDLGLTEEGTTKTVDGTTIPGSVPGGGIYGPEGGYNPATDLTTPPAPVGLEVKGGFSVIYVTWSQAYANPAYTEVWRSVTDDLASAILVGTSIGHAYSDPVEPYSGYYYWIRYVSAANVTGPYNSTSGTYGQSAIDVEKTLEALSQDISNSPLWASLSQRIDKINTEAYVANAALVSTIEKLAVESDGHRSYILSLNSITQTQASKLEVLESRGAGGNRTFFSDTPPDSGTGIVDGIALIDGDLWYETDAGYASWRWIGAAWVQFVVEGQHVYHQPGDPVNPASPVGGEWVDTTGRIMQEGDLWYDSDSVPPNFPWRWNNTTHVWVDFSGPDNSAAVVTLEQTKIGYATLDTTSSLGPAGSVYDGNGLIWNNAPLGDTHSVITWNSTHTNTASDSKLTWHIGLPFAQSVKQVGVTYGGASTTLQQQLVSMVDVDGKLTSQWAVKLDTNGYVAGFGLSTTASGPGPVPPAVMTSNFIIAADKFAIGPATPSDPWRNTDSYSRGALVKMTQGNLGTGPIHVFQARQTSGPPAPSVPHMPIWNAYASEVDPYWVDLNARLPFIATTSSQIIDGKTYPPGVWMQTANIAEATIKDAMIESLTATSITTGVLIASVGIDSARIWGGSVNVKRTGDPADSTDGMPLTPPGSVGFGKGFFLGNDAGTFKFFVGDSGVSDVLWDGANFKVRGWIIGTAGNIGGINMTNNTLYSGPLPPAAPQTFNSGTGFFLDGTPGTTGAPGLGKMRVGNAVGPRMQWDGAAFSIYGTGNKLILSSGGVSWGGIDLASGTPPANVNNSNVTLTQNGSGGGQVILNNSGVPQSVLTGIIMPNFPVNAVNSTTYIDNAAIKTLMVANGAIDTLQVNDGAIKNAKIGDLEVDTFKIGDFSIFAPSVALWLVADGHADDIVNKLGATSLFGGTVNPCTIDLYGPCGAIVVTFNCELEQGSSSDGGKFLLTCKQVRRRSGTGRTQTSTFMFGIINNQPRFSQTAVFVFTGTGSKAQPDTYDYSITAQQMTGLNTNNKFGNQTMTVSGFKK